MNKLFALLFLLASLISVTSCTTTTTVGYTYYPQWYYNCYYDYDYWGYYYEYCQWEYYNTDGGVEISKDIVADVADRDALALSKAGEFYANKFSLSTESGLKLAKTIKDFSALSDRSASDLADFAEKLYGVNSQELVSAVASAQVGSNAELESVISKAA